MSPLEAQFQQAMLALYKMCADETGYKATKFLGMIGRDKGLATVKMLINAPRESAGYAAMWEHNRLDLTVEAVVLENPKWWPLFADEELAKARKRLSKYNYTPQIKAAR